MDAEERKSFLHFLLKRMKELHHEMTIYRAVIDAIKTLGFPAEQLSVFIAGARQSPEIQAVTDRHFAQFEELIEQAGESVQEEALSKLLQQFPLPDDKLN